MPFTHRARFPAQPDRVLDVLTAEETLRDYAAELGAELGAVDVVRDDGGVRTTLHLAAPTHGIAALFQRFVGRHVPVVDRRSWTTDERRGHRADLEVRAEIRGRAAVVRGQLLLTPEPAGAVYTVTGEASVDAPLVARQAEAAVRELAQIVLRRETELVLRRLAPATDTGTGQRAVG